MKFICLFIIALFAVVGSIEVDKPVKKNREGGLVEHDNLDSAENKAEVQRIFNNEVQNQFEGTTKKYLVVEKIDRKATILVADLITLWEARFVESTCLRTHVKLEDVTPENCEIDRGLLWVNFRANHTMLIGRDPTVEVEYQAVL